MHLWWRRDWTHGAGRRKVSSPYKRRWSFQPGNSAAQTTVGGNGGQYYQHANLEHKKQLWDAPFKYQQFVCYLFGSNLWFGREVVVCIVSLSNATEEHCNHTWTPRRLNTVSYLHESLVFITILNSLVLLFIRFVFIHAFISFSFYLWFS